MDEILSPDAEFAAVGSRVRIKSTVYQVAPDAPTLQGVVTGVLHQDPGWSDKRVAHVTWDDGFEGVYWLGDLQVLPYIIHEQTI